MKKVIVLSDLFEGQSGRVIKLLCGGNMRRRLLDLGIADNALLECFYKSSYGDLAAYGVKGSVIALRKDTANDILISLLGKD